MINQFFVVATGVSESVTNLQLVLNHNRGPIDFILIYNSFLKIISTRTCIIIDTLSCCTKLVYSYTRMHNIDSLLYTYINTE